MTMTATLTGSMGTQIIYHKKVTPYSFWKSTGLRYAFKTDVLVFIIFITLNVWCSNRKVVNVIPSILLNTNQHFQSYYQYASHIGY